MPNGKIKKITEKGFGFITQANSDKDLFFHATNCNETCVFNDLKEGDDVQFEVGHGDRGDFADNVSFAG